MNMNPSPSPQTMQPQQSFPSMEFPSTSYFNSNAEIGGKIGSGGSSNNNNNNNMMMGGPLDAPTSFDDEEPLLKELGIIPEDIFAKAIATLLPTKELSPTILSDTDLAGPFFFALCLGGLLLLKGKFHIGYILGFGVIGCLLMYLILNLMCSRDDITIERTISILGYSIVPLLFLAFIHLIIHLEGFFALLISALSIFWSTFCATRLFEKALGMNSQRYLIAYPIMLLYACYTLLTIF
eukprot:TRINITY_DN4062_c0_g1_i1.p1 TRINITY_DN4062_c0_g1~~TRINITY_DN4062_c0_g1_i1.p1  ORF type:complete len:274 (-),score=28.87 TRINITY_DN4062_c0_g1_i1:1008-1721(-)